MSRGLVACGDDDGGGGGDAPSKAEFAKAADRICNKTEKEFESIGQNAESPEDVADAIDEVIDKSRAAADDLVDLERPDGADGETATQFVETFRDFQPRQKPSSFSVDEVLASMQNAHGG